MSRRHSASLGVLLKICYTLVLLAILVAGLWPLNFFPKNQVEWLKDRDGLRFGGRGMVVGPFPDTGQSVTIELRVEPFEEPRGSLPRILTLYDGRSGERFFIGQWKSSLILRNRTREIGLGNALRAGRESLITIVSGPAGTDIYRDAVLGESFPRFSLFPSDERGQGTLLLGISAAGNAGFKGIISGLAICDHRHIPGSVARDCGIQANLIVPGMFVPLKRTILEANWKRVRFNRSFLSDFALNVLGFIPFGFLQAALLLRAFPSRQKLVYLLTLFIGSFLSLMIELVQAYLPARDSDLFDLIWNVSGTFFGIVIFSAYIEWRQKKSSKDHVVIP